MHVARCVGTYPSLGTGITHRLACFAVSSSATCIISAGMQVVNCGAFFLWRLEDPMACSFGYVVSYDCDLRRTVVLHVQYNMQNNAMVT
eukprot:COSAG01_NODE_2045_length_8561_cov_6.449421_10_plen_89_part_00